MTMTTMLLPMATLTFSTHRSTTVPIGTIHQNYRIVNGTYRFMNGTYRFVNTPTHFVNAVPPWVVT